MKLFLIVLFLVNYAYSQCDSYTFSTEYMILLDDCGEGNSGHIFSTTEGGTGDDFYTLSLDGDIVYSGYENEFEGLSAGTYLLSVMDEEGCFMDTTLIIASLPNPYFTDDTGFAPAYCRTSTFQNGGGVVYASGEGVGAIEYEWEELSTGTTTDNSTWGGRNPGDYKCVITDSNGCSDSIIIAVDSINPAASFDIISDDVWDIPYGFAGNAPVDIICKNTSEGVENLLNPTDSPRYHWHMHNYADWMTTDDINFEPEITYNFENLWGIKLVAENNNGCLDTAHQFIAVFGPLAVDNPINNQSIVIISDSKNQNLIVKMEGLNSGIQIVLYDLNGKILIDHILTSTEEMIPFNLEKGTYIYEFIDGENSQRIKSGKLII